MCDITSDLLLKGIKIKYSHEINIHICFRKTLISKNRKKVKYFFIKIPTNINLGLLNLLSVYLRT